MSQKQLAVNVAVHPETQEQMVKACETLSRACAGLALEGIYVSISFSTFEVEEDNQT